ncbi:glutathione ABC transporter permease GsiC [candidate division KSB3 bacterium]|uniref:Glutathione ABC transporter permease GsiC n=1 Tax=candidate division KSB3 bacterium TaxID=2044937 RepID=A0A2G6E974_9BACT|nr:MAG: glutathione ABC transporter permease GsiC [candidate division KSB3 bacterium]PIE29542.1 MAG: glutathione ABC transporter permease GsiC [candidate division KSB3 bacterium]
MQNYIIRRLLLTVPVMLGVVTLVFLFIHFIPGDPVQVMLGESAASANMEELREGLGLNNPLGEQYLSFLKGLFTGDLGVSIHTGQPIVSSILERVPATLELTISSLIVALLISIPLGVISASRQYSVLDNGSMFFALIGISMPNFWLGPLLIILFSVNLGWLPVSGRGGIAHLILPAMTLGTALAAKLTRMTRSSMLEILHEDYITTSRAKGLREGFIMFKHGLRNALLPVITVFGIQFGALLSGALITETIFAWPGIGRLTISAIQKRDYPLVQGCVLFIAFGYVFANLLTDLAYALADPRIRFEKR